MKLLDIAWKDLYRALRTPFALIMMFGGPLLIAGLLDLDDDHTKRVRVRSKRLREDVGVGDGHMRRQPELHEGVRPAHGTAGGGHVSQPAARLLRRDVGHPERAPEEGAPDPGDQPDREPFVVAALGRGGGYP